MVKKAYEWWNKDAIEAEKKHQEELAKTKERLVEIGVELKEIQAKIKTDTAMQVVGWAEKQYQFAKDRNAELEKGLNLILQENELQARLANDDFELERIQIEKDRQTGVLSDYEANKKEYDQQFRQSESLRLNKEKGAKDTTEVKEAQLIESKLSLIDVQNTLDKLINPLESKGLKEISNDEFANKSKQLEELNNLLKDGGSVIELFRLRNEESDIREKLNEVKTNGSDYEFEKIGKVYDDFISKNGVKMMLLSKEMKNLGLDGNDPLGSALAKRETLSNEADAYKQLLKDLGFTGEDALPNFNKALADLRESFKNNTKTVSEAEEAYNNAKKQEEQIKIINDSERRVQESNIEAQLDTQVYQDSVKGYEAEKENLKSKLEETKSIHDKAQEDAKNNNQKAGEAYAQLLETIKTSTLGLEGKERGFGKYAENQVGEVIQDGQVSGQEIAEVQSLLQTANQMGDSKTAFDIQAALREFLAVAQAQTSTNDQLSATARDATAEAKRLKAELDKINAELRILRSQQSNGRQ